MGIRRSAAACRNTRQSETGRKIEICLRISAVFIGQIASSQTWDRACARWQCRRKRTDETGVACGRAACVARTPEVDAFAQIDGMLTGHHRNDLEWSFERLVFVCAGSCFLKDREVEELHPLHNPKPNAKVPEAGVRRGPRRSGLLEPSDLSPSTNIRHETRDRQGRPPCPVRRPWLP